MNAADIFELGRANARAFARPFTAQEEHELRVLLGPPAEVAA